jgi:O-antigen biosynthesis protein WbqV
VTLDGIEGVMAAKPVFADRAVLERWILRLRAAVAAGDRAAADAVFEEAIPDFRNRAAAIPNTKPESNAPPAQTTAAATA